MNRDQEREEGNDPNEPEQARADFAQALGDRDQQNSDRDQRASDRDQRASDEDQVLADAANESSSDIDIRQTTASRAEATRGREETSRRRDQTAKDRDRMAVERDEESALRDHAADSRDREAAILDVSDDLADRHTLRVEDLRGRNRVSRIRAANDRELARRDRHEATDDREDATADRERAEADRDEAALDRRRADGDRELAGTDDLTGTRRRGVGLEELEREMQRAQREKQSLIAAFVDVDGLKAVNDERGHEAGDALLRRTADGLGRHMRPYDLIIRLGGDEFLCVLPGMTLEEAKGRLGPLSGELAGQGASSGSISIGYSELRGGDSAGEFVARADTALLANRRTRGSGSA